MHHIYLEEGVLGTDCWFSLFCLSSRASTWFWISIPFLSSVLNTWQRSEMSKVKFRPQNVSLLLEANELDIIYNSYKSLGLKGTNAVEDHVQRTREESTFPRGTGHGEGLTTSRDAICKQQACGQQEISQFWSDPKTRLDVIFTRSVNYGHALLTYHSYNE